MLLSEQEAQYGVNMYDSLKPEDEPEIQSMMATGKTMEEAVLAIFNRKVVDSPALFQTGGVASNGVHPEYYRQSAFPHTVSTAQMNPNSQSNDQLPPLPPPSQNNGPTQQSFYSSQASSQYHLPTQASMHSVSSAYSQLVSLLINLLDQSEAVLIFFQTFSELRFRKTGA